MSIHEDTFELQSLDIEIKRLKKELQVLRSQKEHCEERIMQYLVKHNQPGIKFNGKTILVQEKQKRKYQKKQEKLNRGGQVLRKYGVSESSAEQLLQELMEQMKGTPEKKPYLKMS